MKAARYLVDELQLWSDARTAALELNERRQHIMSQAGWYRADQNN